MKIRYKVVSMEKQSIAVGGLSIRYSRFVLQYPSLKAVKAIPGTLGIYVYDMKKAAKTQARSFDIILPVCGLGEGRYIEACLCLVLSSAISLVFPIFEELYDLPKEYKKLEGGVPFKYKGLDLWRCPEGSMVYPAVKVL